MIRIRSNLSVFSVALLIRQNLYSGNHSRIVEQPPTAALNVSKPSGSAAFPAPPQFGFSVLFSSSSRTTKVGVSTDASTLGFDETSGGHEEEELDDLDKNNHNHLSQLGLRDDGLARDVKTMLDILRAAGYRPSEIKFNLEHCNVTVSSELVVEVLSRIRNDWEAAFTFFLWAGKQPNYVHSVREYHSMIHILGKMRKFDTAWTLIEEMRQGSTGPSLVTRQTLLIMIRRYCAVRDVGKAISTFYAYKRFNFQVGMEEFQGLLSSLCRYKNVEDAEHLLFCNKNVFPFNTKSFNIILNGWCNVIVSPRQAERIWLEMGKRGIQYDVVSYASIMSCYSKASKLYKVFRLFDQMKKTKVTPDRKVYNAVVHALAKGRFVKEAVNLLRTMEDANISPDAVTYNSLIGPLCKAHKIDEAKAILDEMLQRGLSPTIRTYHAFFRNLRTKEEIFELLNKMREQGCYPTTETYLMLIRKFSRWQQLDIVFKLWSEMSESGVNPDRSSYIVLIHGLFLNGKLEEAYKYYNEMQEKGFLPEPKTNEMLQAWLSGKQVAEDQMTDLEWKKLESDSLRLRKNIKDIPNKPEKEKDFLRQPEIRRVKRERGFSFWDQ
ncbi:pentatricopeptide repeat-containing protein At5g15010, mitochondrial-like [Prosopis cineraria]|uniref:pentatricopeptide repeat-containing protein At5g15010, mitochondrial-like n=1 Tax=Prosopis cineraria TaxID=364024 RepID=UPI00240FDF82|nr:pentatricopeptide repeat-containing protein At5g15010, mitochondrial-like [Prosopis cineraria]